jgi:REP element-mobilizing transposase RayT
MTMRRILAGPGAIYHCITRTVNGERCMDDVAKEVLRKQLHVTAAFCGVELITYALMENHFHLLLRVPPKPEGGVPDAERASKWDSPISCKTPLQP